MGLSPENSREANRERLFEKVEGAKTYPEPGTAYFQELLSSQIKPQSSLPSVQKPRFLDMFDRVFRGKKTELG